MATLKNANKSICGIKYRLFSIVLNKNTGTYHYYLRDFWSKIVGDILIWKSKKKSKVLTRYTLSILGIIYTIIWYLLLVPLSVIFIPFIMYFQGAYNFITDSVWVNHVRFFNWSNITLLIISLIYITLNLLDYV